MELWVRMPPHDIDPTTGLLTEWTNKQSDLYDPVLGTKFHSLPYTLLHEFGHTVSVSHLPDSFVMGQEEIRKVRITPTPNDEHGVTEATKSHH